MKTQKLNCEKARDISIVSTLETLGHFPKRKTEKEAWFLSPFRSETQASFKVDLRINRWYDHGMGKGGNLIDLIMTLNDSSVAEALTFIQQRTNSFSFHQQTYFHSRESEKEYEILRVKSLQNPALINYLKSRKIDIEIAKHYCKEIYYKMNSKIYFSIAFKNNSNGYEIRNKYFKGSLGKKSYTVINNQSELVCLFEGFMDFLSYLTLYKNETLNEDYIILNSVSFLGKITLLLNQYGEIYICFDNDEAGKKATKYIIENYSNSMSCSFLFHEHKDLNDYLKNRA